MDPRPSSDFFEDELIPVGMRGAVVGWFLWAALLLHAERDHARRLRDGVNVIGAAEAEAASRRGAGLVGLGGGLWLWGGRGANDVNDCRVWWFDGTSW